MAESTTNTSTSTSLISVGDMNKNEALKMHTNVRRRGRGAIKNFVVKDTVYGSYSDYYYAMKKIGVMPLNGKRYNQAREELIQSLKYQLSVVQLTPAKRALNILNSAINTLQSNSREFLCSIIAHNLAGLTVKQEKWLSDLEQKYNN